MLYGLWFLRSGLFFLIFLWLIKIEPYVRRRNRTSTFFLYPWAPWKDYLDAVKIARRHRHGTPFFLTLFFWMSLTEGVGILSWVCCWAIL